MDTMNHTITPAEVHAMIDSARMGFTEEVFTALFGRGYDYSVRHVTPEHAETLGPVNVTIFHNMDTIPWSVDAYAETVGEALTGALTAWANDETCHVVK